MRGLLTAHNAFSVMNTSSLSVQTICIPLLQWSSELVEAWDLLEHERARVARRFKHTVYTSICVHIYTWD
eukprot:6798419-Pyramimonas_sp.AAC.1